MMENFAVRRVLYRETRVEGELKSQLVLPLTLVKQALRGLHNDIGHPGRDRTTVLIKERFW